MHTALARLSDIRMTNYSIASLVRTLSRAVIHQNVLSGNFSLEGMSGPGLCSWKFSGEGVIFHGELSRA